MAKLILFSVCLMVLCTAFALECYNCITKDTQDKSCDEFKNVPMLTCGKPTTGFKQACLKSVFKEKTSQISNTTRKCVLLPADGKTESVCKPEQTQENVFCDVCYEDKCNRSEGLNINVFTMFGAVLSILFAKFFLH